jgi:hypothetical protein
MHGGRIRRAASIALLVIALGAACENSTTSRTDVIIDLSAPPSIAGPVPSLATLPVQSPAPKPPVPSASETPTWETPRVSPLRAGEQPPADLPNYFDARELGSATFAILALCQDLLNKDNPSASQDTAAGYCSCLADAARTNVRAGRAAASFSEDQKTQCASFAKHPAGKAPYAQGLPVSTASITATLKACLDAVPRQYPPAFGMHLCSCTTDATLKAGTKASLDDIRRCELAARYQANTGKHLTRRQFAELSTTSVQAPSSSSARPAETPRSWNPPADQTPSGAGRTCCRYCTKGKACGNTCIARSKTCHKGPGCACD